MRRLAFILMLAAPVSLAGADSLRLTSRVTYDPVTINAVVNGAVQFQAAGNDVSKPLTELAKIEISDSPEFNKAEESLAAKKYADAATGFGAVAKASTGWRKTLAEYRQMTALELSGKVDEAQAVWLALCDAANGSPGTLALRPKRMPAKGEAANDRAIALLKAKLPAVTGAYQKALAQAMSELYERQGDAVSAQNVLQTTNGATQSGQLKLAMAHYRQGQFDKAAGVVEASLKELSPADLPTGLLLLGQCQGELAKAHKDAAASRELLLKAGLNYMQIVADFADSDEAPQALFLAGGVNEQLGNVPAARAAYESVLARYGQSLWAKQAAGALESLKKKT